MKNLTPLRYQIALASLIIASINTGCATYQRIDVELLEKNKSKIFKLGIVKAAGDPVNGIFGGPPHIEDKKKALENIPIADICEILSSKYSITIDANVDKTVKVVNEEMGKAANSNSESKSQGIGLTRVITNAYYGNLELEGVGSSGIHVTSIDLTPRLTVLTGSHDSHIINNNEFADVVNVTYSYEPGWSLKFYYYISIASSDKEILTARGIVNSMASFSFEAVPGLYVEHAKGISEALKRDLADANNARYIERVSKDSSRDLSETTNK